MKSKKELINEYKLKKFKIGVFQIRNMINEKIYIDSSVNLDAIWNRISSELKFGGHRNELLQKDWNEFGEEYLKFEILSEIEQKDGDKTNDDTEAKELAQMFIEELKPFGEKGYNKVKK